MMRNWTCIVIAIVCSMLYMCACSSDGDPFADKSWSAGQYIETETSEDAQYPQIGVDHNGNAIAVWQQDDGDRFNIWANRYTTTSGWETAELIEIENAGDAISPQVGMDGSGNAIAVWTQSDGTRNNIWANRFTPGGGWGTAELIESSNESAGIPQVAVNQSGDAVAVWRQNDSAILSIWANQYDSSTGLWGTAETVEAGSEEAWYPEVGMNDNGDAVVVWAQWNVGQGVYNVWGNIYDDDTGWIGEELLETSNGAILKIAIPEAHAAIDSQGNAIAVWSQFDGTYYSVYANRYAAGTGWGTAQLIETNNRSATDPPKIDVDGSNNMIAVWGQEYGSQLMIYANRYVSGSGWEGAVRIAGEEDYADGTDPQISVNSDGDAVVVWAQSGLGDTGYNVRANRYKEGIGWDSDKLAETSEDGVAWYPQVGIDSSGNAVAVWQSTNGDQDDIMASMLQ